MQQLVGNILGPEAAKMAGLSKAEVGQQIIDAVLEAAAADTAKFMNEVAEPAFLEALNTFRAIAASESVEQAREGVPEFDRHLRNLIAVHEEYAEVRLKTSIEGAEVIGYAGGVRHVISDGLFKLANYAQAQVAEELGIKPKYLS
ncbi:MAG TPA: hypothetical protein VN157_16895 [Caulobacter sp.]|nr:hypothetical protein [Caulobacter sp.]